MRPSDADVLEVNVMIQVLVGEVEMILPERRVTLDASHPIVASLQGQV